MKEFALDFTGYILTQTLDIKGFLNTTRNQTLEEYLETEQPIGLHATIKSIPSSKIDHSKGYQHVFHCRYGQSIPSQYLGCSLAFIVHVGLQTMGEEAMEVTEETAKDYELEQAKINYAILTLAYKEVYGEVLPFEIDDITFARLLRIIRKKQLANETVSILIKKGLLSLSNSQLKQLSSYYQHRV